MAYAVECFEKGILTEKDTDGLRLEWGNQDALPKLLSMIARREGIGNILAEGLERAPKIIGRGTEKYAMQARGMTFAGGIQELEGFGVDVCGFQPGPCHVRAFSSGVDAGPRMGCLVGQDPQNTKTRRIVFWRKGSRSWFIVREPRRFQKFP